MKIGDAELVKSYVNGWYHPDDPGEPGCAPGQKRLSINALEGRLLGELVRGMSVLEIGTGLGVATLAMAQRAWRIVTVDPDPWARSHMEEAMRGGTFAGLCPVTCVSGVDAVVGGPFCAAFIDGLHTYEQCTQDIADCRARLVAGGLLIFHDTRIPCIARAIIDSKLPHVAMGTTAGMAVAWNA